MNSIDESWINELTSTLDSQVILAKIMHSFPETQSMHQTTLIVSKPVPQKSNDDKMNLTLNDLDPHLDEKSWLIMDGGDAKEGG